jgi:tetratricopeptide (TPR) repeat protein
MVCALNSKAQTSSAKWRVIETEADTLFEHQDFKKAIELYTKVIELSKLKDKDSKDVLYKRSVCYYSIGEFDKALLDVNTFISEQPNIPQAKFLRAFINRELGNAEAQLSDLNELLELNPMNPDLLKWKSVLYLDSDKFEEAKQELFKIQKFVNDEEIETQLGFAYTSLDQPDSAFIHFEKALSINGGYLPAYMYISSLCLEQEAFDMALTYVDLGLRIEPANLNLLFYKGVALVEKENTIEGCRLLSKVFSAGLDQAADYLKQYCYSNN